MTQHYVTEISSQICKTQTVKVFCSDIATVRVKKNVLIRNLRISMNIMTLRADRDTATQKN